jgi:hypothetical protein
VRLGEPDRDGAALRRVLDAVVDQVDQHLAPLVRMGGVALRDVQLQAAGVQPAHPEDVVDGVREPVGLVDDHGQQALAVLAGSEIDAHSKEAFPSFEGFTSFDWPRMLSWRTHRGLRPREMRGSCGGSRR